MNDGQHHNFHCRQSHSPQFHRARHLQCSRRKALWCPEPVTGYHSQRPHIPHPTPWYTPHTKTDRTLYNIYRPATIRRMSCEITLHFIVLHYNTPNILYHEAHSLLRLSGVQEAVGSCSSTACIRRYSKPKDSRASTGAGIFRFESHDFKSRARTSIVYSC